MPKNFAHLGGLNAYEVLGIEPTATTDEIEAAYRAAIKRQHSDTGGVTRLAQLVNDARDALVKDRASYDAWLKTRPRVTEAEPGPGPAASASDWRSTSDWRSASAGTDYAPDDDPWDPWETVPPPPPPKRTGPRKQPSAATDPGPDTSYSAEEPDSQRSYRRRASTAAVAAIVIGGMSVLCLVSLAIAIPLGLFSEPFSNSSSADPAVVKQGQVVVTPGTKVVLDTEGTSFAPSDDHASLVGTEAGLLLEDGTSHVAVAQQAPERYDTCSALDYPEPTGKPIAWNRLTIGSMLCVRTTYLATTKSLITVVDRSGRSTTLEIITWND
jgi:hypothetical protein